VGRSDHAIGGLNGPPPGDAVIADLARKQYGRVAGWQLRPMGVGSRAIEHRVSTGRLHRLYRDVYAVGAVVDTRRGRWMAAVLACGPDAVLSYYDAGRLQGILRGAGAGAIHVTVPRSRAGHEGIRVHRVRSLDPRDHGRIHNIPVTSLGRTLLDLAEVLSPRRLALAIEEAERLRIFDLAEIQATIERNRGRRGAQPLLAGCRTALEEAQHTRSSLERELLEACRDAGLPLPAMNVSVEDEMVDGHWPGTNLIVELQSWEWHRTRQALHRDSAKALKLEAAGYRVLPVTSRTLAEFIRRLPALLDSSRTRPAPGPGATVRASP
jgi:hypothetical protein